MKLSTIILLVGLTSASSLGQKSSDNIWGDVMGGIDQGDYNKETPRAYKPQDKPKINYAAIAKKKQDLEKNELASLVQKEVVEQDKEDMNIELLTFSKTLKPSHMRKALALKEKLETFRQKKL